MINFLSFENNKITQLKSFIIINYYTYIWLTPIDSL